MDDFEKELEKDMDEYWIYKQVTKDQKNDTTNWKRNTSSGDNEITLPGVILSILFVLFLFYLMFER